MKLKRNEFMLCVEAISGKIFEPPYKQKIISAVEKGIKNNQIDKQYSVDSKVLSVTLKEMEEPDFKELYSGVQSYWGIRDQDYSMIGDASIVNITRENYSAVKSAMKRFLILEIEKYAVKAGSIDTLGVKLGQSEKYARMVLKRSSFSALERLWKECNEKMGA